MIRKTILAIAATVTLGAAALAPTSASAWGGKHWGHHHGHWGHGWGHGYGYGIGLNYVGIGGCYTVKKLVNTDFGLQVRRVTVCS